MKNLSFYKPNQKGTGACMSLKLCDKTQEAVFINLIRQASWDAAKKTGSFKANVKNPNASLVAKLSMTEAAGIAYAIDNNAEFSAFHKSNTGSTQIIFKPYITKIIEGGDIDGGGKEKEVQKGFVLFTTRKNEESEVKISIAFTFGEARLILSYLNTCMTASFQGTNAKAKPQDPEPEQEPTSGNSDGGSADEEVIF